MKKNKFEWTTEDWKKKLKKQAEDSKEYRHKLYRKVELKNKENILDVGCGTGEITLDIAKYTNDTKCQLIGVDIDSDKLTIAKQVLSDESHIQLIKADAQELPFNDETFDIVIFNIVLVYIKNQQQAISEMVRVTKKGGIVLASLEPDYASRLEYPESPVAGLFLKNIQELGADIITGRKLKSLFGQAGLSTVVGMDTETDFLLLKNDNIRLKRFLEDIWIFEKLLRSAGYSDKEIKQFKKDEESKIKNGIKFQFIPCFYAIGKKQ